MNKHNRITRISLLWTIILTGVMYHTILHLVPIFYGVDIVKTEASGIMPTSMVLTFGLSFLIPVLAIVGVNYLQNKVGWLFNFILAVTILLVNTSHLSEFFISKRFDATQLFVIIPLFLVSILLVTDAWKLKNKIINR